MSSKSSSLPSPFGGRTSLDNFNWREKRQRLFIYWCFTHFIHGMVHSIRYSSQYLYFKDVMRASNADFLYGLSVSFIGATGVIFPLIISPFIDRTRKIKQALLVVNILGFFGNLLYALPFSPALPLIGQLLAGTTPAFGVIAMGEISRCYSPQKLTKRISALSLIYSVGTFTSIGFVFAFLYVDFYIGAWHINYANMPGVFLAFAFIVSGLISLFLVSDVSKDFDLKLEERIKRSPCGSTSSTCSSAHSTPELCSIRNSPMPTEEKRNLTTNTEIYDITEKNDQKALRDVGQPFYFKANSNVDENDDNQEYEKKEETTKTFSFPRMKRSNTNGYTKLEASKNDLSQKLKGETCDAAKSTLTFIWKILRFRTTAILMAITFMEAFVYSIIVTSLPVLATKFLDWGKVELALLSIFNKFLSVIISGSIYCLTDHLHDFLLLIYGTLLSLLALLSLSVLELVKSNSTATTVLLFSIAGLSISGVPLIITSTRSMLAKLVPTEIQALTEAVRMSIFEASFVPVGFLVPLITMNVSVTATFLLAVTLILVFVAITEKANLVELREVDEYWIRKDDTKTTSPVTSVDDA